MTGRIWDGGLTDGNGAEKSLPPADVIGVLNIGGQYIVYVCGDAGVNKYGTID